MPGASDRAKGRRRGQKDLPCLGPVTEPKAEEEDRRTKNLPCLGPVTEPDRTHLAGTSDRARGKRRAKKNQGPTLPGASDRARGRRRQTYLPCLRPVTEPEAEQENKRTYPA